MIPRKTLGSGISGAVRYVLGEGKRDPMTGLVPQLKPGQTSRVAWYGGTGLGFPIDSEERLDILRRMMEWAAHIQASPTKRCTQDCLHLTLAWDPAERPSRVEMEAAAHSVLKHLGMAHARAIFVAHHDTEHRHLHLVISRIDPASGLAFPDRFDTLKMSQWALDWEREHGGVRCEARLDRERQQLEQDPDKVLEALFSRRETFTAFDLNRALTAAIPSRDARRAFIGKAHARPDLVRLTDPASGQLMRHTTRQTLDAEHLASAFADRLYADAIHQVSKASLDGIIDGLKAEGRALRHDQAEVLSHATRAEGLAIISGKAGTGKSFTMSAIAAAYEAQGCVVQSLAPTNKVASALKRDGLEVATIHSQLGRLDRGAAVWTERTVVMVDEAGMVSTRLMARLLSYAEQAGAKVILIGDDKQLASMTRGGLFGYLAERYGSGELSEMMRQHGAEQRELARRASHYDFGAALTVLNEQGGLVTVDKAEDRIEAAARIWGERSAAAADKSLFVITVSNADADAANLAIRKIRQERGELGPDQILATAEGLQAFAQGDRILFSGNAASRAGREAGLVNGEAGIIVGIEGRRVSVAIDGAKPGTSTSFTVGKDHEAGEFDALKHGYAGTIYKAQGATYDRTIVIDNASMRASAAYVALTRHRESVCVVTAGNMQTGFESWMAANGGFAALTAKQQASAEQSYDKWRTSKPDAGERHDLHDYVAFVQGKEAERRAESGDVGDMAKRWSRVDDRRAASRFEAQDYQPPGMKRLTPAEVRATVGVEAFERDGASAAAPSQKETSMEQEPPSAEQTQQRAQREADYLAHMQWQETQARAAQEAQRMRDLEERAKAFHHEKEREAEEARKKKAEHDAAQERQARAGDISSASGRYAIALGENYDVRDPYGSLARSAMSESAMFHRNQEQMRAEMAKEPDADKRRIIELRKGIEGCDYMALTGDRLAAISSVVTGRSDNKQAVIDRAQAEGYRELATTLRQERSALIEAVQKREQEALERKPFTREAGLKSPEAARQGTVPEPVRAVAAATAVQADQSRADSGAPARQDELTATQPSAQNAEAKTVEPGRPPVADQSRPDIAAAPGRQEEPKTIPAAHPLEKPAADRPAMPQEPELQVIEGPNSKPVRLSDFMRDLPTPPERQPISMAAFVSDPKARKEQQLARIAASRERETAEKAIGRIGQDVERGKPLNAEDLKSLTREQRAEIRKGGDDGLRQIIKESAQHTKGQSKGSGGNPREL